MTNTTNNGAAAVTYYAVCDAHGPISVRLDAATKAEALAAFAALDARKVIDAARTDAEDDLGIDGADMTESDFADALEGEGGEMVADLDHVINAHAGTVAHLAGGWRLWAVADQTETDDVVDEPTVTDDEIRALRTRADEHDDIAQVVICDLALDRLDDDRAEYDEQVDNLRVAADYYPAIAPHDIAALKRIGFATWTAEQARAECARVIRDAQAQA